MKTIVIGGGPAGIMAAIASAYNGDNVILFEKNEKLGKKLFITGKGRCNVSNPKFLYSAFSSFDNNDVMRLIEDNGTPLKTERGNRVFPVSDHSSDIIKALAKALKDAGVEVRLNESIKSLLIEDIKEKSEDSKDTSEKNSGKDKYRRQIKGIVTDSGKKEYADRVIICTGGISYKSTGSTGDGLHWAGESGHRIESLKPALVPLETKEKWVYNLQGLTLKNVKLSLIINEKTVYKEMGEMLFTHFGISGPLVLTASSILASYDSSSKKMVHIDLKPALTDEEFDQRLIRELKEGNKKEIKNIIGNIYPVKLGLELCKLIDLDIYKKCNEINKEERNKLVNITKRLPISISGTRDYNEAIITHGGVSVKDINPKSMESKIIKDLYFAGEVLDVDAFTGGFNLQIAFSTGYLAGSSNRY